MDYPSSLLTPLMNGASEGRTEGRRDGIVWDFLCVNTRVESLFGGAVWIAGGSVCVCM